MVGRYTDGSNTYTTVGADVTAVVTFNVSGANPAPSVVIFSTTNTSYAVGSPLGPLGAPVLQLPLNLTTLSPLIFSGASNSLTGPLGAPGVVAGLMTGSATAKFYGPPTGTQAAPAEFGGAFFVRNGSEQMNGSFALKKL
jgi:hypothetical protein